MTNPTLKFIGTTLAIAAFTAGTAFAGNGKDCDHKKETATKTEATSMQMKTEVMSTSAAATSKAKMHKVYSAEDAAKLCAKKQVKDMEACVTYKTGKTKAVAPKT